MYIISAFHTQEFANYTLTCKVRNKLQNAQNLKIYCNDEANFNNNAILRLWKPQPSKQCKFLVYPASTRVPNNNATETKPQYFFVDFSSSK